MRIEYSLSLWNYSQYAAGNTATIPELDQVITTTRSGGYGIELWGHWGRLERVASSTFRVTRTGDSLYSSDTRRELKPLLEGMNVSLHSASYLWEKNTIEAHVAQIEAAADLGGRVVVVHPTDFVTGHSGALDGGLAREVVSAAEAAGVRIALENDKQNGLPFLTDAIRKVDGLGVCLDTCHLYFTPDPMGTYLDALRERLIHLHIGDTVSPDQSNLALVRNDHHLPGTGGIPAKDWDLLAQTLRHIDFDGIAVFEILPMSAFQIGFRARRFFEERVGCSS